MALLLLFTATFTEESAAYCRGAGSAFLNGQGTVADYDIIYSSYAEVMMHSRLFTDGAARDAPELAVKMNSILMNRADILSEVRLVASNRSQPLNTTQIKFFDRVTLLVDDLNQLAREATRAFDASSRLQVRGGYYLSAVTMGVGSFATFLCVALVARVLVTEGKESRQTLSRRAEEALILRQFSPPPFLLWALGAKDPLSVRAGLFNEHVATIVQVAVVGLENHVMPLSTLNAGVVQMGITAIASQEATKEGGAILRVAPNGSVACIFDGPESAVYAANAIARRVEAIQSLSALGPLLEEAAAGGAAALPPLALHAVASIHTGKVTIGLISDNRNSLSLSVVGPAVRFAEALNHTAMNLNCGLLASESVFSALAQHGIQSNNGMIPLSPSLLSKVVEVIEGRQILAYALDQEDQVFD